MELAVKDHEGCQVEGWLDVQRVAGNFHISVHADDFFLLKESQQEMAAAVRLNQQLLSETGHVSGLSLGVRFLGRRIQGSRVKPSS